MPYFFIYIQKVKGSYLKKCTEPIKTTNRYYYETWLGLNGSNTFV